MSSAVQQCDREQWNREEGPSRLSLLARTIFTISIVLALAVSCWLVTRPLDVLLGFIPDDAFYYLQIARHLAAGLGSSFDGQTTTNGYHPLWMLVVTGLAYVVHDREALLRSALAVSLLFSVATGIGIARLVARWFDDTAAWLSGAAWLLCPLSYLLARQTVEASCYSFTIVLAALAATSFLRTTAVAHVPLASRRTALGTFGGALGLTIWARTEAILLALCAAGLVLHGRTQDGKAPRWPAIVGDFAVLYGTMALTVAPVVVYNLCHWGTISQDSGAMKLLWSGSVHSLTLLSARGVRAVTPAVIVGIVVLKRWQEAVHGRLVLWLQAASVLQFVTYSTFFSDMQIWYLALPYTSLFLTVAVAIADWTSRPASKTSRAIARTGVIVAALATIIVTLPTARHLGYPWQRDVYLSQQQISRWLRPQERIGCFNAGIPAYFSDRFVTNLDGLVNHEIHPYYMTRTVDAYLQAHHITIICDEDRAMSRAERYMSGPLRKSEIARYPLTMWPSGPRHVWRIR